MHQSPLAILSFNSYLTSGVQSVAALSSLMERRCLADGAVKPALVSSIFLSNNGETFATVEVSNSW
jgi:hypothetical protein